MCLKTRVTHVCPVGAAPHPPIKEGRALDTHLLVEVAVREGGKVGFGVTHGLNGRAPVSVEPSGCLNPLTFSSLAKASSSSNANKMAP